MCTKRSDGGFTLIELLAVIAIILLVIGLAMPNFVQLMRGRRWTAAIGNIQSMVMRARALATNVRKDFSVEFDIQDNGTCMWLESEVNEIERTPDLWELQHEMGGGAALRFFIEGIWRSSGGNSDGGYHECICTHPDCGYEWQGAGVPTSICPKCGVDTWQYRPMVETYYYNITYDPTGGSVSSYGDNAHQSKDVPLGHNMTIDPAKSPNFVSWDSLASVECYGGDDYRDIRIGTNGALVQTIEPVICLKQRDQEQRKAVTVVRCTGRLVLTPVP